MAAASGPPCVVCHKRVSIRRVTRCPWCRQVLCLKCTCPRRCFEIFSGGPARREQQRRQTGGCRGGDHHMTVKSERWREEQSLSFVYGNLAISGRHKLSKSAFKKMALDMGWTEEEFKVWANGRKWEVP